MTRLEALSALRDKVEAGEWFPGLVQLSFGGVQNYNNARDAYNGSVDAALDLIEAVGITCRIEMIRIENGAWLVNLGDLDSVENAILSRALLLAILAVLIEREKGNGSD